METGRTVNAALARQTTPSTASAPRRTPLRGRSAGGPRRFPGQA